MPAVWRVALVDSCGIWPTAGATCRFIHTGERVAQTMPIDDASGHGTRLAGVIAAGRRDVVLTLAQVLDDVGRASADVVAAGIDWCVEVGVDLVHLSLGLRADRQALALAVRRAVDAGCIVVAAAPARGPVPYPAAYAGVIRATGDARCQIGVISRLDDWTFGGCVTAAGSSGGGASVGAAHVTRALIGATPPCGYEAALAALDTLVQWRGPERR